MANQDKQSAGFRWQLPASVLQANELKLMNSFSRVKSPFCSAKPRLIKWYTCGPTVYDVAHLGHARCYITFDIIRRILQNYFGYHVFYVMNITDIDDKIIKRARSNHLCQLFLDKFMLLLKDLIRSADVGAGSKSTPSSNTTNKNLTDGDQDKPARTMGDDQQAKIESAMLEIKLAIDNYESRRLSGENDPLKIDMINKVITNSREAYQQLKNLITKIPLSSTPANVEKPKQNQLEKSLQSESQQPQQQDDDIESNCKRLLSSQLKDVIADEQDAKFGHTIKDNQIFKRLSLHYEQEFHDDMRQLDVLPPSALTRVSEYIDEVGLFIEGIANNGFAYEAGGSVYFDTNKFDADPKHSYAKLVREAYGQKGRLDEGEGELSQQDTKRSPNDFALWKKSKPGEPTWSVKGYEPGRPGWHIECSVMASELLGNNFDIHSGGCDLKFPHHDNEIAQAEAYFNTGDSWVNYFIHSGHLTISGCKMSKSLKNFITIRDALKDYTSRQLRFAFLAHGWTETLDYSPNTMSTASSYEKTFREFLFNVSDVARRKLDSVSSPQDKLEVIYAKWTESDKLFNEEFLATICKVDAALCDNFDTRTTLNVLSSLIKEYNKSSVGNLILIRDATCYVTKILGTFGVDFAEIDTKQLMSIMDKPTDASTSASESHGSSETAIKYVDAMAKFRADIRKISKESKDPADSIKQILSFCDKLRDDVLPELGVRLEDKEVDGKPYVIKLVDAATLAKEREMAERAKAEKEMREAKVRLEKLQLQKEREEKMKIPPTEMFRSQTDKYSRFDDKGMPTHDADGKEITKSAMKKLQKLYADQEAKYNKYLESQRKS